MKKLDSAWFGQQGKSNLYLESKINHLNCVIDEGNCSCNSDYVGKTIRNSKTRFSKHEKLNGKSAPSKHLINKTDHELSWMVLPNPS